MNRGRKGEPFSRTLLPRRNRLWPWECDCVKQKSGLISLTAAPNSEILRKMTRQERQGSRLAGFFPLVTCGGGITIAMSLAGDIQGRDIDDESRFSLLRFDDGLNDFRLVVRRIVDCGEDEQASSIKRSRTSRSMVKRCSSIVDLNPEHEAGIFIALAMVCGF